LNKIVIFGNSGSGKSTLAKNLCDSKGLAHLDLDSLAWEPGTPPVRKSLKDSKREIDDFLDSNSGWVVEGCYSDLIQLVLDDSTEVIFLDLPTELSIANAKARPWEPHKYDSKKSQDANLNMLLDWIAQYDQREDTFSRASHQTIYESYKGRKAVFTSNPSWPFPSGS
jgi:adenylate kinase family enzyme